MAKTYIWQHPSWPNLTYDSVGTSSVLEQLLVHAGELAGSQLGLSAEQKVETLASELSNETVSSFAIEGIALSQIEVKQSIIASLRSRDVKKAAGAYASVAEMMLDARNTNLPMSLKRLNGWHRLLFANDRYMDDVGQLRTSTEPMQVVTLKRGVVREIHYEAPPADLVANEINKLVNWINRTNENLDSTTNMASVVRAAIAHFWFETIHPYSDGNGRVGRALADFVSSQNSVIRRAPFSLSKIIESDKNRYYQILQEAQGKPKVTLGGQLDITPFVVWFLETMDAAIRESRELAVHLNARNQFFNKHREALSPRQEKVLMDLFERGPGRLEEGLSSRRYRRSSGVSRQTATRDLNELLKKKILNPATGTGPSTVYQVNLDEFLRKY